MDVASDDIKVLFELLTIVISILMIGLFVVFIQRICLKEKVVRLSSRTTSKSPFFSALLSLAVPGTGQIYNGETHRGVSYLIAFGLSAITIVLFMFLLSINFVMAAFPVVILVIFLLVIYVHSIKDASETSREINQRLKTLDDLSENGGSYRTSSAVNLFATGNYEPALYAFTEIIEKDPTAPGGYYNRAVLYYKLGDYSKAKADLITAAKLGHEKSRYVLKASKIDY